MSQSASGSLGALRCPECETAVLAEDVSLELNVGLCRPCNSSFDLQAPSTVQAEMEEPDPVALSRPPKELMDLASPPKGLVVRTDGEAIELSWRWLRVDSTFLFLCLWCFFWDGFLVVWYSIGISSWLSGTGEALMMLVFPLLHVAVGVGMTYGLLARLLNRTTIRVDPMRVQVSHGPLPWKRTPVMPTQPIDQLYLVRQSGKGKSGFGLVARQHNRTSVELANGIPSDEMGRYIEQRLESWMGIEDAPVKREWQG